MDKFRFQAGDIRPYKDLHNVEVVVFHSWNASRVRIASVDEQNGIVTFTGPTIFRPLAWDPNQRYHVKNARELLDSPGEWYLDRQVGTLYYRPLPGENMTKAEVDSAGKGRIWTGLQAKELGLVDELGGLTIAINLAKQAAGIPKTEDARLVVWPKKRTLWQTLFGGQELGLNLESPAGLAEARQALGIITRTRIWAIMPFWTKFD